MANSKIKFKISRLLSKTIALESFGGLLVIIASAMALIIANSEYHHAYFKLLSMPIQIGVGEFILSNPFQIWVNELLMVFFFMMVALEIKEELLDGHLSTKDQLILPLIATIAGVALPALIFYIINYNNPEAARGWAIPIVTDIAFALCVLSFFKKNIPPYLRVFLLSLAIFDDLIGIIIIAIFYSKTISFNFFAASLLVSFLLIWCNIRSVGWLAIYLILGAILWCLILKSGIHATIAGVIVGFCVPLTIKNRSSSPLKKLMHYLHPWVSYIIVPIFAFSNAGIALGNLGLKDLLNPLPLGIMLGLFIGKQLGVFISCFLLIKTKLVILPFKISWLQLYGVAILTGIGFTVSLFLGELAFSEARLVEYSKIGIVAGSLASALFGFSVLKISELCRK